MLSLPKHSQVHKAGNTISNKDASFRQKLGKSLKKIQFKMCFENRKDTDGYTEEEKIH